MPYVVICCNNIVVFILLIPIINSASDGAADRDRRRLTERLSHAKERQAEVDKEKCSGWSE